MVFVGSGLSIGAAVWKRGIEEVELVVFGRGIGCWYVFRGKEF